MSSSARRPLPVRLAVCAAAVALGGAAPALAGGASLSDTTYPASLDRQELLDWMKRETDIQPGSVVAVSHLAMIAIMQTLPVTSPQGYEVTVRAEILDPDFAGHEQLLSWHATIKLDCAGRSASVGEATGHAQRNLLGEGHPVEVTAKGWKPVVEGSMQGQIWRARCDRTFTQPLAADEVKPPPPAAAPAPAPVTQPAAPVPRPAPTPAPSPAPLAPTRAAAPPAPQTIAPKITAPQSVSPKIAPPKAVTSATAATTAVRSSAQILAAPTAAEAQRALDLLKTRHADLMAGLRTAVVAVQAGTVTHHRAIVTGFKAPGDASRFCQQLTATGGKCLVRGDAGLAAGEHAPTP